MAELSELEQRLRRLEDIEAIRQLKARYCTLADRGYDGAGDDDAGFAGLFAEDGVFHSSAGPIQGREAIRARCASFHPFGMHLVTNPVIEVDGDEARASWSAWVPSTTVEGQALVVCGRYEEQLVRTAGGWRYAYVRFRAAFRSPYETGWGKTRFMSPEPRPEAG